MIRYKFNRRHGWVRVGLPLLTRSQIRRLGLIAVGPFSVATACRPRVHKPLNISGLPHFTCLWLNKGGMACIPNKDWAWYRDEILFKQYRLIKVAPEGAKE